MAPMAGLENPAIWGNSRMADKEPVVCSGRIHDR
jgi:hypothetical protein